MRFLRVAIFFSVGLLVKFAEAQTLVASSGKNHVQLVELFSSESCSSCPPADEWVSGLKDRSGLFTRFVPVVFHVDYWNHPDCKDEFSSNDMTRRQQRLAQTWSQPAVYTPGFIVDGKEWRGWRESTLPREERPSSIELKVFKETDGNYSVQAEGLRSGTSYSIRIAKLGLGIVSKIASGENSGKTLTHDFVVLDWKTKAVSDGKDSKVRFDAFATLDKKKTASKFAVVAWIEKTNSPAPLQAAGALLK